MAFELDPPEPDGLVTPEVGPWSLRKHRFLSNYIAAFTTSMRRKWQLHYVDLFANSGVQLVRGTNKLIWGSPLIAAQAPHHFQCLHLCEKNPAFCEALEQRLHRLGVERYKLLCGDANEAIATLYNEIPDRRTLTLTFVDPYGFHAHYDMFRVLSGRRTDLIIFFPDRVDANRNLARYAQDEQSSLSLFLGTHDWVKRVEASPWARRMDVLGEVFREQLGKLGFEHVEFEPVYSEGTQRFYQLVFASKNDFGLTLWRRVQAIKPDGQRGLFSD